MVIVPYSRKTNCGRSERISRTDRLTFALNMVRLLKQLERTLVDSVGLGKNRDTCLLQDLVLGHL